MHIKIQSNNFSPAAFYKALMERVSRKCGISGSFIERELKKALLSLCEGDDGKQYPFYTTNQLVTQLKRVPTPTVETVIFTLEDILKDYKDKFENQEELVIRKSISRVYIIKEALKGK